MESNYLDHLSWSKYRCWKGKSKKAFREKYVLGEESFSNKYTEFGNKFHKALEKPKEWTGNFYIDLVKLNLPDYPEREKKLVAEYKGVKFLGYLDAINPEKGALADYKTSKNKITQSKVNNMEQITLYYFLYLSEYGEFPKKALIHWLETEETSKGVELTGNKKTLETKRSGKQIKNLLNKMLKEWPKMNKYCKEEIKKLEL